MKTLHIILAICLSCLASQNVRAADTEDEWVVTGHGPIGVCVVREDCPLFNIQFRIFEDWSTWAKMKTLSKVIDGKRVFEERDITFYPAWKKPRPTGLDFNCVTSQRPDGSILFKYRLENDAPTDYHMPWDNRFGMKKQDGRERYGVGPFLLANTYFNDGRCLVEFSDGRSKTITLPPPAKWGKEEIRKLTLSTEDGQKTVFTFDPAIAMHCDHGDMRLFVRQSADAGKTVEQTMVMTLPVKTKFEHDNRWVDTSDWIVYENRHDYGPGSVIGVEDWLDKPAGKRGWVKQDGHRFVLGDGTPIKFFGVNISWADMACPRERADQWCDRWAKYGVNLVRLHKFIKSDPRGVMTPNDHSVPSPRLIPRFDYFHAAARKRGIYSAWSPVFHMSVSPADKDKVKYYDEILANNKRGDVLLLKTVAPDIQDLLIDRVVKLLNRKNTVTGIRYADDPALAYIELQNEDDIFDDPCHFDSVKKRWPSYYRDLQHRFNDFLRDKYKNQQSLEKAWGEHYPKGQTLSDRSLRTNYPWWEKRPTLNPRERDTLLFLYQEQHAFYHRFVAAIRETGYQGAICGSCWRGWGWYGHLFNLLTDYEVGFIDRHTYSPTIMDRPGAGCLSIGFQQIEDRPFNLSEWGGGPLNVPTINFYGLGLQGWAAQCQFSSSFSEIRNVISRECQICCDDFIQVGQWPALARCVHRGDVKTGDIVARRRISIPGLMRGDVGITEQFSFLDAGGNHKEFEATVPDNVLAAGRVVLEFIDAPPPEHPAEADFARFIDTAKKVITSTTGQLQWHYGGRGYYTVDTPGTQAVIGYAGGRTIDLGDVTIRRTQDTALKLYVTALNKDGTLRDDDRLLVTAFGRDANTGMVFDEFTDNPLKKGGEPLLLEPVEATITIKDRVIKSVLPLDHAGRIKKDAKSLKIHNGSTFSIDGKQSKTMYYLVEMNQ